MQPLLALKRWPLCSCPTPGGSALAVSGPLWIGPLQHLPTLDAMAIEAAAEPLTLSREGARLLGRLRGDGGWPARSWPHALVARHLASAPSPLRQLVERLRQEGFAAAINGVMPGQVRSDAPWATILALAADGAAGPAK